jgi:capsular exopolysaccharide synthesis family protein
MLQTSSEIETGGQEIHLRDYLIVLDRHKWLIIAIFIVVLSATVLYSRRQVQIYQAQTRVIIEPKQLQSTQYAVIDWLDLDTQMQVIKTTPVLISAVKRLNLATDPEGTPKFSAAVRRLSGSIDVSLFKNSKMVTITAKHSIPERAQAIANTVAQAYIDQNRLSRLEAGRDAVGWLSAQLADLRTKLKDSEEALQQFKESQGMITLDNKRSGELDEISRFNTSYVAARANRLEIEAIIDKLESEGMSWSEEERPTLEQGEGNANISSSPRTPRPEIPIALLRGSVLQRLGTDLNQLQTELADKRRLFKDIYPGVIQLKDRIQLTKQKILAELERQRDFLQAQERSFLAQQEVKHQESLKSSREEMEYLALEREVTINREMYNALLTKVTELSLAGRSDLNNIRIVEPAELPMAPIGRGKPMMIILGGFLGLFLGIGSAFFLEYMVNTIKTPDDVAQHLDLPVLGVVPHIAKAQRGQRTPIILQQDLPRSIPAESYRSLRTKLLFSKADFPKKTIVITSTGPKEGKSTTAVNLGMALAQAEQSVLLVDADLRRPVLHQVFGTDRNKGLSAVLAEEMTIDEAIVETGIPNLSLLAAGMLSANPSEILGASRMKELTDQIRERYDIALFDSAPLLGMTDTVVLTTEADATVLVIKTGSPTRKALKIALAQLEQVGAEICGVVLNNVDVKRDRYYYHNYYYY